jgi:hypothetical protein
MAQTRDFLHIARLLQESLLCQLPLVDECPFFIIVLMRLSDFQLTVPMTRVSEFDCRSEWLSLPAR